MNRYYYINKIYNSILKRRLEGRKKIPTRKLVEDDFNEKHKDLKKHIEEWLMFEYYTSGGGKPQEIEDWRGGVYLGTYKYTYTLADAANIVLINIEVCGEDYYEKKDSVEKWFKKKENKKLLKLK